MDLISVIVPVYKVEKYLDKCVSSIVNQTYRNLEIILVDDGSPDHCGAMCDAWAEKDERIKVIHKENGGLSDARNAGMDAASGEYIAFADSDDWIDSRFLSHLHRAIHETGAEIAACDIQTVYETDPPATPSPEETPILVYTPEEAIGSILRGEGFRAVAWNKLYHRSCLEGERYPVGKHHEDEFLTYRILAKAKKLAYVDLPLYFYLQRSGSIMHTVTLKRLDALDAYLERLAHLKERFPALYQRDKVAFCISCTMFYRQGLKMSSADRSAFLAKIRSSRKQIHFTLKEYTCMSGKERIYAYFTSAWMEPFCWLLNRMERNSSNG